MNPLDEVLLFRFSFDHGPLAGREFWATPGGGLEGNETFKQAAERELFEETGIVEAVGDEIGQRMAVFKTPDGQTVQADERYFCVRVFDNTISSANQSAQELDCMKEHRWWPPSELEHTQDTVFPERILELINQIPKANG